MRKFLVIVALGVLSASLPAFADAPDDTYVTGVVTNVLSERKEDVLGVTRTVQQVTVRPSDTGADVALEVGATDDWIGHRQLKTGDSLMLERLAKADGTVSYVVRDAYRLPALVWLAMGFFVLTVLFGGLMGLTSALGLILSILILVGIVIPLIADGYPPFLVSFGGAVGIAVTTLLLAHGFRRRTYVALVSTLLTLGLSAVLSMTAVWLARLSGLGSEETIFLQSGRLAGVDLHGLLLGGMIIGCLGVLDDITTAQTAAVDEISRANPSLRREAVYRAGLSVGREHIASLTNTIALAYVGASFPLLLLLHAESQYPLWSTLNSEFFAEEIVRTLVGSSTLVLAVPVATWLAVHALHGRHRRDGDVFHHHHHHGHAH